MKMTDPKTINRIHKVIEKKFSYYPKTKEVLDLKEELLSIVLDKYNDLNEGTEQQKYKECMTFMKATYKQVLHDLEVESSKKILKDKILGFSIFGTFYFIVVSVIYIIVSQLIVHSYQKTYFIVLAAAIFFSFLISFFIYKYSKQMKFEKMTRVFLGISFLTFGISLFTIPSLYLSIYKNIHIWHPAWLIIFVLCTIYLFLDNYIYPNLKPYARLIRNCLDLLMLFTTIYLIVSIFTKLWPVTWLIFILYIGCVEINILLYFKRRI